MKRSIAALALAGLVGVGWLVFAGEDEKSIVPPTPSAVPADQSETPVLRPELVLAPLTPRVEAEPADTTTQAVRSEKPTYPQRAVEEKPSDPDNGIKPDFPWHSALNALASPGPDRRERAMLDFLKTTVRLGGERLDEVLAELAAGCGLKIVISPEALELFEEEEVTVHLRLVRISLKNTLNLLLASHESLVWYREKDTFHVGIRQCVVMEEVAEGPDFRSFPLERDAEQVEERTRRITVNFPDTPLREVISFIQDITGENVIVDSSVDTESKTVNAKFSAPLSPREVLLKLVQPIGLDVVRRHEALFVTQPEEAAETRASQAQVESDRQEGATHLQRVVPGSFASGTPVQAAGLVGATGLEVGLDDAIRSSTETVSLPPNSMVEEVCERIAIRTGMEWRLQRSMEDTQRVRLDWFGSDAASRALLQNAWHSAAGAPERFTQLAQAALADLEAARTLSNNLDLAALRDARRRKGEAYGAASVAVARAWVAADAAKGVAPNEVPAERIESAANLARALRGSPNHGRGSDCWDASGRLAAGNAVECAGCYVLILRDVAIWLGQPQRSEPHPGAALLR